MSFLGKFYDKLLNMIADDKKMEEYKTQNKEEIHFDEDKENTLLDDFKKEEIVNIVYNYE